MLKITMKKNKQIVLATLLLVVFGIISCSKKEVPEPVEESVLNLPGTPFDYVSLNLPRHFTANVPGQPLPTSINGTDISPTSNPLTNHGATLG